jgi:hypothetical protein
MLGRDIIQRLLELTHKRMLSWQLEALSEPPGYQSKY